MQIDAPYAELLAVELLTLEGEVVYPAMRRGVTQNSRLVPTGSALLQNFLNPFNPMTTIPFVVRNQEQGVHVQVEIYNPLGQRMRTLVSDRLPSGSHSAHWDGKDDAGRCCIRCVRLPTADR